MKPVTIDQILTPKEIEKAIRLYRKTRHGEFNKTIVEKLIEPNMARINKNLGQENDPRYLGYAVEYALLKAGYTKDKKYV